MELIKQKKPDFAEQKTVYQYDDNGVYLHETIADLSPLEAEQGVYLIPANCTEIQPDFRGLKIFSKNDRSFLIINKIGEIPTGYTTLEPPSEHHSWNGKAWAITPETQAQLLVEKKEQKLNEINQTAQAFINQSAGLDKIPDFEIRTWVIQSDEAKEWAKNKDYPTPTLDVIAKNRGVPPDILKQKALEKTLKFEMLVATVAGQRQRYEGLNKVAKTVADVEAINPVFSIEKVEEADE